MFLYIHRQSQPLSLGVRPISWLWKVAKYPTRVELAIPGSEYPARSRWSTARFASSWQFGGALSEKSARVLGFELPNPESGVFAYKIFGNSWHIENKPISGSGRAAVLGLNIIEFKESDRQGTKMSDRYYGLSVWTRVSKGEYWPTQCSRPQL